MASLAAILIPLALLHGTSGNKPYTSKALNIIGTDVINDVFRVYSEYIPTHPLPNIPNLVRDFLYPDVQGKHVWVNASKGTLEGKMKLEQSKEAELQFDSEKNVVTAKFLITFQDFKINFKPFNVKFGNFQDAGQVSTSPKKNVFQLTMDVRHKPASGNDRCVVTLVKAKTVEMSNFLTTTKGFGDPAINKDINNIIQQLFSEKVLGTYIDEALKLYAAQTAPQVFQYCRYVDYAKAGPA